MATDVGVQMQVSHPAGGAGKISDLQEEAQQVFAREGQADLVRHCRHHDSHMTTASNVQKMLYFLGTAMCLKIVSIPKSHDSERRASAHSAAWHCACFGVGKLLR